MIRDPQVSLHAKIFSLSHDMIMCKQKQRSAWKHVIVTKCVPSDGRRQFRRFC